MAKTLSKAEVNHLRLLLGWVSCEIGHSPEEFLKTMAEIAPSIDDELNQEAKNRLIASYNKSANIPKYVRQAVKQLQKAIKDVPGEIVDAELESEIKALPSNFNILK